MEGAHTHTQTQCRGCRQTGQALGSLGGAVMMRAGLEPNHGDTSDGGQQVHSGARSAISLGSRDSGRRQMAAPTGYPHCKRLWFIAQSHKKEQIETASTLVEWPEIYVC